LTSAGGGKLSVGREVGTLVGAIDIIIEWVGCGKQENKWEE
jgi:hypothetical protein